MAELVVVNNVTLDGVMQAPAAPDEDARHGFTHGGWAVPYVDEVMERTMGAGMGGPGAMLFGRRTYEHFFTVWPGRTDNPYSAALDNAQKHVASTTLAEPLPWRNSTLISGDVPGRVRELKRELDGTITVLGSGRLIHTLIEHDLIDRYVLPIMPVALGAGGRLFPADRRVPLELIDSLVTTTGVTINTYRPARP